MVNTRATAHGKSPDAHTSAALTWQLAYKLARTPTHKARYTQMGRQTDRQTDSQPDSQPNRQTDRQADRQTPTQTPTHVL